MPGGFHPTAEVVEEWPAPNFDNPETHGPVFPIVAGSLGGIAFIAVCARLWSRKRIQCNVGLDDWFILASLVS